MQVVCVRQWSLSVVVTAQDSHLSRQDSLPVWPISTNTALTHCMLACNEPTGVVSHSQPVSHHFIHCKKRFGLF